MKKKNADEPGCLLDKLYLVVSGTFHPWNMVSDQGQAIKIIDLDNIQGLGENRTEC